MKGQQPVIDALNGILANELTAVNQYFLHARMLKNWGYDSLAKVVYEESIEEMKHAQCLIDRILFLEGLPNLQKLNKILIGETVPEMFDVDLKLELKGRQDLIAGIKVCFDHMDHPSREMLEDLLEDTEEHIDFLETQLGIVKDIGKENYLAQKLGEKSSS